MSDILRKYQRRAKAECLEKIDKYWLCFLLGELRTGKTITALFVASEYVDYLKGVVLFVTKKKVIRHVKKDFKVSKLRYDLRVINYEQLHKVNYKPQFIVWDESHKHGAFPKPSKVTRIARKKFSNIPCLYLTGTPSPESFAQLFHQMWISRRGPWTRFSNFYQWAKVYIKKKKVYIGNNRTINVYKQEKEKGRIQREFSKFAVTMTQKEAGFDGKIIEKVHTLRLPDVCVEFIKTIKKKKFDDRRNLTADSVPKLMTSIHQISSGTYIDDDGERIIISDFKARYIKKYFRGKKIAIFYVYIAEGEMLRKYFKYWTDDPEWFDYYENVPFICQVKPGSEGIDLRSADDLIFFNIGYSAVTYYQARARSQSIDGGNKRVHFIFTDWGIEQDIYRAVLDKETFTTKHFDPDNYDY